MPMETKRYLTLLAICSFLLSCYAAGLGACSDGGPESGSESGAATTAASGSTTESSSGSADNNDAAFLVGELLGRPTSTTISINTVPAKDLTVYFEYGTSTGTYSQQTIPTVQAKEIPFVTTIHGLEANTQYFYRLRWATPGETTFASGAEHTFHTARAPGQSFGFTIQADPHLDDKSDLTLYQRTLTNQLADAPDFMLDLGDTFMCEKHSAPFTATVQPAPDYPTVQARYLYERGNFGLLAHSVPLFLVNGNHEGESGWLLDGTSENMAVWASLARQSYYLPAPPDGFYSGTTTNEPFVGTRASWYAWTWGDALFVVLDPYWNTQTKSKQDGWVWTLGEAQYRWLVQTLQQSRATFRFVFIHNLVGGLDGQGRGGIEAAPFYEWGGQNADGTAGFDAKRSGWGQPIHDLLRANHVSAVFHGHDHVYVRQELDGIIYQELPQPSIPNYESGPNIASAAHYQSGVIISSSGHLRVRVSPQTVEVAYVRAYRPEDENGQRHNGDIADSYTLLPR